MSGGVLAVTEAEDRRLCGDAAESAVAMIGGVAWIAQDHAVVHVAQPLIGQDREISRLLGNNVMSVLEDVIQVSATSGTAAVLAQPGCGFGARVK